MLKKVDFENSLLRFDMREIVVGMSEEKRGIGGRHLLLVPDTQDK